MKRALALLVLGAMFLTGYYMGRSPESPDIIGWVQHNGRVLVDASKSISATVGRKTSEFAQTVRPEE